MKIQLRKHESKAGVCFRAIYSSSLLSHFPSSPHHSIFIFLITFPDIFLIFFSSLTPHLSNPCSHSSSLPGVSGFFWNFWKFLEIKFSQLINQQILSIYFLLGHVLFYSLGEREQTFSSSFIWWDKRYPHQKDKVICLLQDEQYRL